ncbi:amino acid ABC transporter permease [Bradyrhizobium macuxiense]|uniref:Amino acid ABC transporter permease n=1 Tax=Bradyrhizobium macuxiense TaxID=1755647 RepID=A0A109JYT8_9BRAD|nr:amino acid ABC transporter permease [Bradyrhizobium macuxiense]KWV57639.1 amino acid ABC transporter permease [Bradyrhizobium macuxiense]
MLEIIQNYWILLLVGSWPNGPLGGFTATLILAFLGMALSFPIAIMIGIARTGVWKAPRLLATVWVYAFRGVPLVMIIFWSYFVLPRLTGIAVPAFVTALCAIVVYESAFLGEIVRAGLQGLPAGQAEAARSIGLSYGQTLWHVMLPQALVNMVPSIVNQFVSTIKATSIVYIIGVQEVTFAAQQVSSTEVGKAFQTFMVLACFYFAVCYLISLIAQYLERRIHRKQKGAA